MKNLIVWVLYRVGARGGYYINTILTEKKRTHLYSQKEHKYCVFSFTAPEAGDSDCELSDGEINKLLIITPHRPKKHDG